MWYNGTAGKDGMLTRSKTGPGYAIRTGPMIFPIALKQGRNEEEHENRQP